MDTERVLSLAKLERECGIMNESPLVSARDSVADTIGFLVTLEGFAVGNWQQGTKGFVSVPLEQRFWEKVDKTSTCWLWTGTINSSGYGVLDISKHNQVRAHRFSYEKLVGAIPQGLTLDHLCRIRRCVRPSHLEPVTGKVNTLRGVGVGAINARKAECNHGHPFSPDNTYVYPTGERQCRTCKRAHDKRAYEQKVKGRV